MEAIDTYLPGLIIGVMLIAAVLIFLKIQNKKEIVDLLCQIADLKADLELKKKEAEMASNKIKVLEVSVDSLDDLKRSKTDLEFKYDNLLSEKNKLERENISFKESEDSRIKEYKKSVEAAVTLQESLDKEKSRLNDERLEEKQKEFDALKSTWNVHEKEVEQHIRLICKNNIITYVDQKDFPYAGKKPDNIIEILDQYIIFDAKSPANNDLNNFPKYIRAQTENLRKYAKHDNVKNDLFLVIPSNTLTVVKDYTYNIGDYNVFVISKDSLEPIILSLRKIEEYEFVDKLSPEERDNICRIIGKFAHSTKRKIQIEQFFAEEFLDILQKCKTQLPKDILGKVIEFENAEKLNPPMEKRRKPILTQELIDKKNEIRKETELRDIPEIQATIEFKKSNQ